MSARTYRKRRIKFFLFHKKITCDAIVNPLLSVCSALICAQKLLLWVSKSSLSLNIHLWVKTISGGAMKTYENFVIIQDKIFDSVVFFLLDAIKKLQDFVLWDELHKKAMHSDKTNGYFEITRLQGYIEDTSLPCGYEMRCFHSYIDYLWTRTLLSFLMGLRCLILDRAFSGVI